MTNWFIIVYFVIIVDGITSYTYILTKNHDGTYDLLSDITNSFQMNTSTISNIFEIDIFKTYIFLI